MNKDRNIKQIFTDWPFLNEHSKLIGHATHLLDKPVDEVWQNALTNLAEKMRKFFKELCISTKASKGNLAEMKEKMQVLLAETKAKLKSLKSRTPYTVFVFRLIMLYFQENEEMLLKVIAVSLLYVYF